MLWAPPPPLHLEHADGDAGDFLRIGGQRVGCSLRGVAGRPARKCNRTWPDVGIVFGSGARFRDPELALMSRTCSAVSWTSVSLAPMFAHRRASPGRFRRCTSEGHLLCRTRALRVFDVRLPQGPPGSSAARLPMPCPRNGPAMAVRAGARKTCLLPSVWAEEVPRIRSGFDALLSRGSERRPRRGRRRLRIHPPSCLRLVPVPSAPAALRPFAEQPPMVASAVRASASAALPCVWFGLRISNHQLFPQIGGTRSRKKTKHKQTHDRGARSAI